MYEIYNYATILVLHYSTVICSKIVQSQPQFRKFFLEIHICIEEAKCWSECKWQIVLWHELAARGVRSAREEMRRWGPKWDGTGPRRRGGERLVYKRRRRWPSLHKPEFVITESTRPIVLDHPVQGECGLHSLSRYRQVKHVSRPYS